MQQLSGIQVFHCDEGEVDIESFLPRQLRNSRDFGWTCSGDVNPFDRAKSDARYLLPGWGAGQRADKHAMALYQWARRTRLLWMVAADAMALYQWARHYQGCSAAVTRMLCFFRVED